MKAEELYIEDLRANERYSNCAAYRVGKRCNMELNCKECFEEYKHSNRGQSNGNNT